MGKKKSIEKWYDEMNKQFEEDSKTNDYSDPEMDKWFYAKLDEKKRLGDKKRTEKWYEEVNKQFEEDCKTNDYKDPEMDRIFDEMLDAHFKKGRKHTIAKVAGIAAGVAIVLGVGTNVFTEVAYGESVIEIIRNSIEAGQFTVSGIGNADVNRQQFEDYAEDTVRYEANSIEGIFEQIEVDKTIELNELFYVTDIPEQYQKWTAKYNTKFQRLMVSSQQKDNYLYIYEEMDYENITSGTILESDIVATVFNENLQVNINIVKQMDSIRNEGYYLEVFYNNKYLVIEGNGTLEEFKIIAENISLVQGGNTK